MTKITVGDILRARRALDSARVPTEGRCLLLPEWQARNLYGLDDEQVARAMTRDGCLAYGVRFFIPGEVPE